MSVKCSDELAPYRGKTNCPWRARGALPCPIPARCCATWLEHRERSGGTALTLYPGERTSPAATKGSADMTWSQQEQRAQRAPGTPSALQRGSDCVAPPFLAMLLPPWGYGPNAIAEADIQMTAGKAVTAFLQSTHLSCQLVH